jgi:hypothetical protein
MTRAATDAVIEAMNGGVGSLTSKLVTFPLDLIKTRAASSPLQTQEVIADIFKRQGLLGFYQGLGPKLVKSVTGKVLYYFIYSILSGWLKDGKGNLSTWRNLVVGFFSEVLELPVVMPLEAVATRVQVARSSGAEAFSSLLAEGKLYVSLDAYVLGAMQPAIQNTIFDQMTLAVAGKRPTLSALESFVLGVLASSIAITVTYPLDFARTVAQGRAKKQRDDDSPAVDDSMLAVWKRTVEAEGVLGVFKGLSPCLAQGVLSSALMLMVKAKIANLNRNLVNGLVEAGGK